MGFFKNTENTLLSKLPRWFSSDEEPKTREADNAIEMSAQMRSEAKRTRTVRKREFDKLRNLRQKEAINDGKPRQKFSHSSLLTDLQEKTSTLKKIDEIEAQMSMQWWKTDILELPDDQI